MPELSPSILWTGVLLGVVALFTTVLKNVPAYLFTQLRRLFVVRVEVINSDNLFEWLKVWFDKDHYSKKTRLVTASAVPVSDVNTTNLVARNWKILFTPSPGYHLVFYRRRPILVHRDRKDIASTSGSIVGMREIFALYFFTRSQSLVREFLHEAESIANEEKGNKLTIFSADYYQNWSVLAHRDKRSLDSIILEQGVREAVFEDIIRFLRSEEWYRSMSIPFHRGYLFHGPPGGGKSSLAIALASALNMDMYLLNMNNLNDTRLISLLSCTSAHSVVLLEDVDSAFTNRESSGKVTFSGFLNALDGVYAKDGILLFMSTNHLDRLDPALLRPGRVDCKVYLGNASRYQQEQTFLRFFPAKEAEARSFAEALTGSEISMATLQEYLLSRRDEMHSVLKDVGSLINHNHLAESPNKASHQFLTSETIRNK